MFRLTATLLLTLITLTIKAQTTMPEKPNYGLSFNSEKELSTLNLSDSTGWIISKNGNGGKCLKQVGKNYQKDSTIRSTILFKTPDVGSYILEADVMQTPTNYDLVHLCLIFGYQGADQYAFAQLASQADRFTHNVFIVDKNDQQRILEKQEKAIDWGFEQWHKVKIERNTTLSSIKVWVDDSLVFESNDERLMHKGQVGLGNSGDSYKLDNLKLWIAQ
ncbi:MAG: hypothetical protein ACWA6U_06065 [Breznakibacter sp.]